MMKAAHFFRLTCLWVGRVVLLAAFNCQRRVGSAAVPVADPTPFVHPGVVNSRASLALVAAQVSGGDPTRQAGYAKVVAFTTLYAVPTNFPRVVYAKASGGTPSEDQIRRDCLLAYAHALCWAQTGDAAHAQQAQQILDGYAGTFQRYEPDSASHTPARQSYLEAAWVAPTFVAAAEIIRYYQVNGQGAGWPASSVAQFDGFLRNLQTNYVDNVPGAVTTVNNWQASYCYAKMALGVWFDDPGGYQAGYTYLRQHLGDFIRADGNVSECGRDCHHLQYTLCALTYAAETARIQGDPAPYGFNGQAIKNGWLKYGEALAGSTQCNNCQHTPDNALFPAIETAGNFYGTSALPALADRETPYGVSSPDNTFLGFTSYTHRGIGQTR